MTGTGNSFQSSETDRTARLPPGPGSRSPLRQLPACMPRGSSRLQQTPADSSSLPPLLESRRARPFASLRSSKLAVFTFGNLADILFAVLLLLQRPAPLCPRLFRCPFPPPLPPPSPPLTRVFRLCQAKPIDPVEIAEPRTLYLHREGREIQTELSAPLCSAKPT